MPKNSLIDNDFLEEDLFNEEEEGGTEDRAEKTAKKKSDEPDEFFGFDDPHEKERSELRAREVVRPKKKGKKGDDLEIEIVDDTPEADKGKWVADPEKDGDLDEPDEDEAKEYSKKVRQRLDELTARSHAERRRAEQFERQLNELIPLAQRYLQENNNLKGIVESGEKVLIGEHKSRLESQLESAKTAFREASEAGDTNGVIAAQEQIARVVAQIDRLSTHRPQQLVRDDPNVLQRFQGQPSGQNGQNGQQEVRPTQEALAWRQRNPWFDTDMPMRAYAFGLHQQLVGESVQPDTAEYYKRIDTEMRRRFPDRFQGENGESPRRRGSVVAPASRSGGAQPRKVTLTESQVRVARRLGLTPQQMAEQILAEQENGSGKEFTHVKGR